MADGGSSMKPNVLRIIEALGEPAQAFDVELTPELAKKLLASQVGVQRPLRAHRVKKYRQMIASGDWPYTGQGLVISTMGEMLNGGHTCTAVVQEGKSIPRILVVVNVETEAFAHMDDVGARSGADNLPVGTLSRNTVAAALTWLWREEKGKLQGSAGEAMPASDTPQMLSRYADVVDSVSPARLCRHVGPPGLMTYAHYRCRRHDPAKADEFFAKLAEGSDLSNTSPIYWLRERLMRQKSEKTKLPQVEQLALVMKAWAKFCLNEPTKTLRWRADGPLPELFPRWPGPGLRP